MDTNQPVLLQHEWSLSVVHDCYPANLTALIPLTAGISSMYLSLRVDALLDQEKKHTMYSVGSMAGLMGGLPGQSWPEPAKLSPSMQSTPACK